MLLIYFQWNVLKFMFIPREIWKKHITCYCDTLNTLSTESVILKCYRLALQNKKKCKKPLKWKQVFIENVSHVSREQTSVLNRQASYLVPELVVLFGLQACNDCIKYGIKCIFWGVKCA